MKVVMTGAVVDPGNGDAPLSYTVDGEAKQIPWSALHDLYEDRLREVDQHHTPEQKILAFIVGKYWIDYDDWWADVCATDEDAATSTQLGCDYRGTHFGAVYPDAQCVQGYLWDEDSCDEPGGPLLSGGDIPCPKCNAPQSSVKSE